MTKKLFLVRHAQAINGDFIPDVDRTLTETGINNSYKMAKQFLNNNKPPELILSSIAARALHTANIFTGIFETDYSNVLLKKELYLAHPETIIQTISKVNNNINSLMVFGHNPGLTDLTNYFASNSIDNIPTNGIAGFSFKAKSWIEIQNQLPSDSFFDYPKNII